MPKKSKKIIQNSLEEIKAQNTIFLDLSKLNSFTDFLVITSGTSSRHMSAIKDKLIRHCSAFGYIPYINLLNQILI